MQHLLVRKNFKRRLICFESLEKCPNCRSLSRLPKYETTSSISTRPWICRLDWGWARAYFPEQPWSKSKHLQVSHSHVFQRPRYLRLATSDNTRAFRASFRSSPRIFEQRRDYSQCTCGPLLYPTTRLARIKLTKDTENSIDLSKNITQ